MPSLESCRSRNVGRLCWNCERIPVGLLCPSKPVLSCLSSSRPPHSPTELAVLSLEPGLTISSILTPSLPVPPIIVSIENLDISPRCFCPRSVLVWINVCLGLVEVVEDSDSTLCCSWDLMKGFIIWLQDVDMGGEGGSIVAWSGLHLLCPGELGGDAKEGCLLAGSRMLLGIVGGNVGGRRNCVAPGYIGGRGSLRSAGIPPGG